MKKPFVNICLSVLYIFSFDSTAIGSLAAIVIQPVHVYPLHFDDIGGTKESEAPEPPGSNNDNVDNKAILFEDIDHVSSTEESSTTTFEDISNLSSTTESTTTTVDDIDNPSFTTTQPTEMNSSSPIGFNGSTTPNYNESSTTTVDGLSDGELAAIVVCSILAAVLLLFGIMYAVDLWKHKKQASKHNQLDGSDSSNAGDVSVPTFDKDLVSNAAYSIASRRSRISKDDDVFTDTIQMAGLPKTEPIPRVSTVVTIKDNDDDDEVTEHDF